MECTHHLRCSEADRIRWFELRDHVHNLIELGNVAREDGYIIEFVSNNSNLLFSPFDINKVNVMR